MPGAYLLVLLVSIGGVMALDARLRLALWPRRGDGGDRLRARNAGAIVVGTAFFLVWDAVGIATGVFVKGDSPYLLGVDLAPHLPIEEPLFLAFLCYLALTVHAADRRFADRAHSGPPEARRPPGARDPGRSS